MSALRNMRSRTRYHSSRSKLFSRTARAISAAVPPDTGKGSGHAKTTSARTMLLGFRPCDVVLLRATPPLRSGLRSEPVPEGTPLASGFAVAPNLAVMLLVYSVGDGHIPQRVNSTIGRASCRERV